MQEPTIREPRDGIIAQKTKGRKELDWKILTPHRTYKKKRQEKNLFKWCRQLT